MDLNVGKEVAAMKRMTVPEPRAKYTDDLDGMFYIGSTDDLDRRLSEHNAAEKIGSKFTHKNGPWRLVWSEPHTDRASAIRRERQIRKMKSARWIREKITQW